MKRSLAILALLMLSFAINVYCGTLKDLRDGKTYRTVKIGDQEWMAENLNKKIDLCCLDFPEDLSYRNERFKVFTVGSWCYENKASNCKKYGRLYTWMAALDACPIGWHLPDKWEFETLINTVGNWGNTGKMLKSKKGWSEGGNGIDAVSFTALPAGRYLNFLDDEFINKGNFAFFWSASEGGLGHAFLMRLDYNNEYADLKQFNKTDAFSVRCVKDSE